MSNDTQQMTLVVGGTGKTGRRVTGAPAGARRAGPGRLALRRAAVRLERPRDVGARAARRDGGVRLLLPRHRGPGRRRHGRRRSRGWPRDSGVRRLVLLSGRGEEEAERAERLVQDAGAEWTIVRCSWFSQNFSEGYLLEPVLAGEVALPVGDVPEPFVDVDDIADVAVAALTEDGHAGRALRAHRPAAADVRRRGRGDRRGVGPARPVRVDPDRGLRVGDDRAGRARRRRRGCCATCSPRSSTAATPQLTDGVQQALGRAPRDFADYARDAAATGVWG